METNHTPATWTITEIRRGSYDQPREQWEPVFAIESDARPGATLCEVLVAPPVLQLEEARANAEILAAAPDLLAAAKALLEKLEVFNGCNPYDMDGAEAWPEFDAMRAAITKAARP